MQLPRIWGVSGGWHGAPQAGAVLGRDAGKAAGLQGMPVLCLAQGGYSAALI